ncbi:MAG: hypothetical protein ACO1RT_05990 [Planctomycetaceae bacterium]
MTHETLALASYAWTRRRRTSLYLISIAVLGEVLALGSLLLPGDTMAEIILLPGLSIRAMVVMLFSLLFAPILLYAVVLFDFTRSAELTGSDSGYDSWLLRQPIETWKLALIPAGFMTLWIVALWGVAVVTLGWLVGIELPFFQQALAMCAVAIFACGLVWRPHRGGWQRLVVLLGSVPFLYALATGSVAVAMEFPEWTRTTYAVAIGSFFAANLFAWQSVSLARVSAYQQRSGLVGAIPSQRSERSPAMGQTSQASALREFSSPSAAMRWHDRALSRLTRWRLAACFAAPMMLLAGILPLTGATAIFALVMAAMTACFVAASIIEPPVWSRSSSLPTYLIASPLRSSTIAWSRLTGISLASAKFYWLATLYCLLALVWQDNREIVAQWWAAQSASEYAAAPVRIVVTLYLTALVVSVGLAIRVGTLSMYGQQKPVAVFTFVSLAASFGSLGLFLVWFLGQTDWEIVQATTLRWLAQVPTLAYGLLGLKLTAAAISAWLVRKRGLVVPRDSGLIALRWCAAVAITASGLWTLWPGGELSYPKVLLVTAIVIPFSPWLFAPVAVDANRHRGNG